MDKHQITKKSPFGPSGNTTTSCPHSERVYHKVNITTGSITANAVTPLSLKTRSFGTNSATTGIGLGIATVIDDDRIDAINHGENEM